MSAFSLLLERHEGAPTCNCAWIARHLGFAGSAAAVERYLTGLIADAGFPRPLPHLKHGGGIAFDVAYGRSEWIRAGVEEWLGDFLPPEAALALTARAEADAASEMDHAALSLAVDNTREVA